MNTWQMTTWFMNTWFMKTFVNIPLFFFFDERCPISVKSQKPETVHDLFSSNGFDHASVIFFWRAINGICTHSFFKGDEWHIIFATMKKCVNCHHGVPIGGKTREKRAGTFIFPDKILDVSNATKKKRPFHLQRVMFYGMFNGLFFFEDNWSKRLKIQNLELSSFEMANSSRTTCLWSIFPLPLNERKKKQPKNSKAHPSFLSRVKGRNWEKSNTALDRGPPLSYIFFSSNWSRIKSGPSCASDP